MPHSTPNTNALQFAQNTCTRNCTTRLPTSSNTQVDDYSAPGRSCNRKHGRMHRGVPANCNPDPLPNCFRDFLATGRKYLAAGCLTMQQGNLSGVATTLGALTYYENHVLRPSLQLFFDRSALLNAASIRALRHFCLHPTSDVTPLMTQHVAPPCRVFDAIFSERRERERGGGFTKKKDKKERKAIN